MNKQGHFPRIAATALSAAIVLAVARAQAGEWLADAASGCLIWDPNPQLEETVKWSGACVNGRAAGPGVVQWFKGGVSIETDQGEWRDGHQAGKGVQSWATGRYEGEISNGEPNGHGVLTIQRQRYEGEFRNGRPNGIGTLSAGGETVHGTWKDGCLQDGGGRKASIGVPLSACR